MKINGVKFTTLAVEECCGERWRITKFLGRKNKNLKETEIIENVTSIVNVYPAIRLVQCEKCGKLFIRSVEFNKDNKYNV